MKSVIIPVVIALACYSLANLINGRVESISIAPITAAVFAGVGAYSALLISHGGR